MVSENKGNLYIGAKQLTNKTKIEKIEKMSLRQLYILAFRQIIKQRGVKNA